MQNIEWLQEQLGDDDDDYLLFDCPGEILPCKRDIGKELFWQSTIWE